MGDTNSNSLATILGRWQPLHLGHQAALHAICDQFKRVIIGIGSSNIQDYRNPFSLAEVTQMLNLGLTGYANYELIPIPDVIEDREWCQMVNQKFGQPDYFVTANPYVESLLNADYQISHPRDFIPPENMIAVSGTVIRREMARGEGWKPLVPAEISEFISARHLDQRFRELYGLQTLALETIIV